MLYLSIFNFNMGEYMDFKVTKIFSVPNIVLFLSLIIVGTFNEYISCLLSAVILFFIIIRTFKGIKI